MLTSLERHWYKPVDRAIIILKTKSDRSFMLPLSGHMVKVIEEARLDRCVRERLALFTPDAET